VLRKVTTPVVRPGTSSFTSSAGSRYRGYRQLSTELGCPRVRHSVQASAETMIAIATDPKHLGARIGVLSVLHTPGALVPGGGISIDRERWVACRPNGQEVRAALASAERSAVA
jgi:hypothetical protein